MNEKIPYGRQSISQADIDAVVAVLRSDWLTQGPVIAKFEKKVADYCGARFAVAVSNATAALHLACLAANIGPGKTVWTSPMTFVASANCALYCGGNIDFVDVDPRTGNMSVEALREKLVAHKKEGKLPDVVIPVHFSGNSCDMRAIHELAKEYEFAVIEDAAHAIGGSYHGKRVGSCQYSDMTIFSFHPVKIITTGEGGMILTNHEDLYQKLLRLRSHGITREPSLMRGQSEGAWYYQQIDLGFNYRITDLQAALGLSQMDRIDQFVIRRRELAARYSNEFEALSLDNLDETPGAISAYHLYVIRLKLDEISKTRSQVFTELRNENIEANVHYIPVHRQPYYQDLGFKVGMFPNAEKFYSELITMPLYPDMSLDQQDHIIKTLKSALV